MLSRLRRLRAIKWPASQSRGFYALALAAGLVLLALIPVGIAQSSRRPAPVPSGLQAASRALIEGRYDEVPALTEKLDQQDPNVAAVRARALIARGRYEPAEALLRPIAGRAPTSDAALELGLLLDLLGREEAIGVLSRVAAAATSNEPQELGRAARALRARGRILGRRDDVENANDAFRDAVSMAPKDAGLNTEWGEHFLERYQNDEALKSFQDALAVDPKYGPAM